MQDNTSNADYETWHIVGWFQGAIILQPEWLLLVVVLTCCGVFDCPDLVPFRFDAVPEPKPLCALHCTGTTDLDRLVLRNCPEIILVQCAQGSPNHLYVTNNPITYFSMIVDLGHVSFGRS